MYTLHAVSIKLEHRETCFDVLYCRELQITLFYTHAVAGPVGTLKIRNPLIISRTFEANLKHERPTESSTAYACFTCILIFWSRQLSKNLSSF